MSTKVKSKMQMKKRQQLKYTPPPKRIQQTPLSLFTSVWMTDMWKLTCQTRSEKVI